MTVRELIEELKQYPEDYKVVSGHGDSWHFDIEKVFTSEGVEWAEGYPYVFLG